MKDRVDVFIIGGGINGAAVARDAAGRGLSVILAEKGDYANATSSASSKLIHGGLRYLEHYEFRLVAESLKEREIMMQIAPHLVFPLRFLLPITNTQPRPAFIVRLGLWLYDKLSNRRMLAPCGKLSRVEMNALTKLRKENLNAVLHYPDCWVDDARLTLETLMDARSRGADIGNYRDVTSIHPADGGYTVIYRDHTGEHSILARFVVNASGPWTNAVLDQVQGDPQRRNIRLIRGSHIVLTMSDPPQKEAYTLQGKDGRVIFSLPWMDHFLIIGTTDVTHHGAPDDVKCSDDERDYLLQCFNEFFSPGASVADIIWSYAGVRPLVDDGSENPSKLTRDYVLQDERHGDGGLITIYGGKITTHRKLAEKVLAKISSMGMNVGPQWTEHKHLHGGSMDRKALRDLADSITGLSPEIGRRWVYTYGSETTTLVKAINKNPELTCEIAPNLPEAELIYAVEKEDVQTAEDFLYRRTKMFMFLRPNEISDVAKWFKNYRRKKGFPNEDGYNRTAC